MQGVRLRICHYLRRGSRLPRLAIDLYGLDRASPIGINQPAIMNKNATIPPTTATISFRDPPARSIITDIPSTASVIMQRTKRINAVQGLAKMNRSNALNSDLTFPLDMAKNKKDQLLYIIFLSFCKLPLP